MNLNPNLPPFGNHADAISQACRTKPLFEPGSKLSYSSAGTMVLGGVIERVTGLKFDEFCAREIFLPLRMNDTVFRPGGNRLQRVAPSSAPARGQVDDSEDSGLAWKLRLNLNSSLNLQHAAAINFRYSNLRSAS